MNPKTWTTSPISHRLRGLPWWKRQLGEVCPHGAKIFLVNGSYVRNTWDSDFTQGGNEFAYKFIPTGEIWIDECIPEAEWPFVAFHECYEAEKMRRGMSYDKAHDLAKRLEDRERQLIHPGEVA